MRADISAAFGRLHAYGIPGFVHVCLCLCLFLYLCLCTCTCARVLLCPDVFVRPAA